MKGEVVRRVAHGSGLWCHGIWQEYEIRRALDGGPRRGMGACRTGRHLRKA